MTEKDRVELAIRRFMSQSPDTSEKRMFKVLHRVKLKKLLEENRTEKFTFFWRASSIFSQWHMSSFVWEKIEQGDNPSLLSLNFNCAEQYMMYRKAVLFFDHECAEKILSANSPKEQKKLGRKVRDFDEKVWKYYRTDIVYSGNKKKFTQNEDLLALLKKTKGTTLVEASPHDRVWGVGLSVNDSRIYNRDKWRGKNLLGEILTYLRVELCDGEY